MAAFAFTRLRGARRHQPGTARGPPCARRGWGHPRGIGPAEHVTGADAFVVPTLVSYEALHRFGPELGFPKVSLAELGEVREAGLQSLEILRRAGVKIGSGTDLLGPCTATSRANL